MSATGTALGMTTKALSAAFELVKEVQLRQLTDSMRKYEVTLGEVTDVTVSRHIILHQSVMAAQCTEKMDMLMALYWGHQNPELSDFDLYEEQMRVVGELSRLEILVLVHLDQYRERRQAPSYLDLSKTPDFTNLLQYVRTYFEELVRLTKKDLPEITSLLVRLNRTGLISYSSKRYNLPGMNEAENKFFTYPPIPSESYSKLKSHINDKFFAEYSAEVVV